MLLSNTLRRVAAKFGCGGHVGIIYTLYPLITYHMIKTRLLMQDSIVVMICDSTDTVIRKIQVMRLDYILCMVIINS